MTGCVDVGLEVDPQHEVPVGLGALFVTFERDAGIGTEEFDGAEVGLDLLDQSAVGIVISDVDPECVPVDRLSHTRGRIQIDVGRDHRTGPLAGEPVCQSGPDPVSGSRDDYDFSGDSHGFDG